MDWFDELATKMRERAAKTKHSATRQAALGMIDVFEQNKDGLIALGKDNVMEYLGMLGRGEEREAQEFFIRNTANPDALINGVAGSAGNILNAPNIDWTKTAIAIATAVGELGARMLLTFLIGLI